MAGINFILGIDGSKARAQAEAAGKDIKNGIDKSTKGTSKGVDDLSKSLGTARSNAKQLHEDLLGAAAGGTKSMSSLIGLAGDLAKALKSPAGILAALTLAGSYALSTLQEKSKQLGEIITSYLELRLKQAEASAQRVNAVKLEAFKRELESAGESIERMNKVFAASIAAQKKLAGSEAESMIAFIDYKEAKGTMSHEKAAKARQKIKADELKRTRELEDAETKRIISDAEARVAASKNALNKAKTEERRGLGNAESIESLRVGYADAIKRGDREQETSIVREFNELMEVRGSQERLKLTDIEIRPFDYVRSEDDNLAESNSIFTKAINEATLKTNEVAKWEAELRKATQELADARAIEANTITSLNRTRALEDAKRAVQSNGENLKAKSEDINSAKSAAAVAAKAPNPTDKITETQKEIGILMARNNLLKMYPNKSESNSTEIAANAQSIEILKQLLEVSKQTQKNTESLR